MFFCPSCFALQTTTADMYQNPARHGGIWSLIDPSLAQAVVKLYDLAYAAFDAYGKQEVPILIEHCCVCMT